jgi:hypothetical protein
MTTPKKLPRSVLVALEAFSRMPDEARVRTSVVAVLRGCSERTVRADPRLTRIYDSDARYKFKVGQIRALLNGDLGEHVRRDGYAQRLREEVAAAPNREAAREIWRRERERLQKFPKLIDELADLYGELAEGA